MGLFKSKKCKYGDCIVYDNKLCCNCGADVTCRKKKKYGPESRLDSRLVGYYKSLVACENAPYGSVKQERFGIDAIEQYIKLYQPKLLFLANEMFGYSRIKNNALYFIRKMSKVTLRGDYEDKVSYIWEEFYEGTLDISLNCFFNSSLYDRNYNEFTYTCNALSTFSDLDKASIFIKDTSVIDFNRFFDDNGNIKPAGNESNDEKADTIFNIIEEWAYNNEYTPQEIERRKFERMLKEKY